jgi:two-component system sensor histidine kinase UhpB
MIKDLKILMLEDDPSDAEFIQMILKRSGLSMTITLVSDQRDFIDAVQRETFDAILADNSLPQFNASNALNLLKEQRVDTPFILVTGTVSEEYAVDIIKKGADDYILKGNLTKLPSALTSAIEKHKTRKEKERAELALRESEKCYRILFEQASDGIVITNKWGQVIDANNKACLMTGYSFEELMQLSFTEIFLEENMKGMKVPLTELVDGKTIVAERRLQRKDGSLSYVELSAKQLGDGRFQAIARDVTDRKRLEAQLMAEKIQQQKNLVQATLDGQEKERTDIGRELHDNINQILVATRLFLDAAETDQGIKDDMIKRSMSNVDKAIEEVRRLSKSLVTPSSIEELGLQASIQDLIETIQLTTLLNVQFHVNDGILEVLTTQQQVALYRIVQEQLNNIIKHAAAKNIYVSIDQHDDYMELTIEDDGRGFEVDARHKGIGLSNMQNRAELLNGHVDIQSTRGQGCTLRVTLPVNANNMTSTSSLPSINKDMIY